MCSLHKVHKINEEVMSSHILSLKVHNGFWWNFMLMTNLILFYIVCMQEKWNYKIFQKCLIVKKNWYIAENIWGVAMKFSEWFYCKHSCILTINWGGSSQKCSLWAAVHFAQWCCHCWKHIWNTCCGIAFSAIVTLFFNVFIALKSLSL
jgi:hypothetical protein